MKDKIARNEIKKIYEYLTEGEIYKVMKNHDVFLKALFNLLLKKKIIKKSEIKPYLENDMQNM